jgi:hypothetical protein
LCIEGLAHRERLHQAEVDVKDAGAPETVEFRGPEPDFCDWLERQDVASISSVNGSTDKTTATVYTKASIYKVGGGTTISLEGEVPLEFLFSGTVHENIAYDWLGQGGKRSRPFITLAAYDALKGAPGTRNADGVADRLTDGLLGSASLLASAQLLSRGTGPRIGPVSAPGAIGDVMSAPQSGPYGNPAMDGL